MSVARNSNDGTIGESRNWLSGTRCAAISQPPMITAHVISATLWRSRNDDEAAHRATSLARASPACELARSKPSRSSTVVVRWTAVGVARTSSVRGRARSTGRSADELAAVDDEDPVGEDQRLLDVVRDEEDRLRLLAPELEQHVVQAAPGEVVERAERLVHQPHVGAGGEHGRERDALAHAARELARPRLGELARGRRPRSSGRPSRGARGAGRPSRAAGTRRCRARASTGRRCPAGTPSDGRCPGPARARPPRRRRRRSPAAARRACAAAWSCRRPSDRGCRRTRPATRRSSRRASAWTVEPSRCWNEQWTASKRTIVSESLLMPPSRSPSSGSARARPARRARRTRSPRPRAGA